MMITYVLLGFTVVVSYLALSRHTLIDQFVHMPYREKHQGEYYRMLSSGFLHGSINHLFINMFVLYQFGTICESYFSARFGSTKGTIIYLIFYFSAIVIANMGTFLKHSNNPGFRSLGASGVTSALVFIYCLFDPWQMFIFPPVPAIIFAVLYVAYSQWAIHKSSDNIDHQGHLWGSLYGLLFIVVVDPLLFRMFWQRLLDF